MISKNAEGYRLLYTTYIVCPNPDCRRFELEVGLYAAEQGAGGGYHASGKPLLRRRLAPDSCAKPFPEYIPVALRIDYNEACGIKDLSPKSAATLARRCLQGMIRDFWGIRKSRLIDEITALQEKVDVATWEAIDAIRRIGNIGAHMERDVNTIVDVEPAEAEQLIGLIETLFEDWYITRHEREQRMQSLKALADNKEALRQVSAVPKPETLAPETECITGEN